MVKKKLINRIYGVGIILIGMVLIFFYLEGTINGVSVYGLMEKYNHSFGSDVINILFLMLPGTLITLGIILFHYWDKKEEANKK